MQYFQGLGHVSHVSTAPIKNKTDFFYFYKTYALLSQSVEKRTHTERSYSHYENQMQKS